MYYITDLYTFLHMQSYAQHIIYHHRIKYYIKTRTYIYSIYNMYVLDKNNKIQF